MKQFSLKTGLITLIVYTILLSLLAFARGSANNADFLQKVLLVAISGFLVGYFLDPLARALHGSFWKRFGILAFIIFSLASLSNTLEIVLYLPAVAIAGTVGSGIIQTFILAVILTKLTRPVPTSEKTQNFRLSLNKSIVFIILLAVVWIPVYFLFVALDTPVVHFLEHGGKDLYSHPSLLPMLGLEFIRGGIHASVMLVIAFLSRRSVRLMWLWGSLAIAILNGWLLILPTATLPFGIRIANGVEITLSSITFAGIAAYFFLRFMTEKTKSSNR